MEALAAGRLVGLSLNKGRHKCCGGATGKAISVDAVTILDLAVTSPALRDLQCAIRRQKP